jgi:hypothetical protein
VWNLSAYKEVGMNKILTHKAFGGSYDFDGEKLTCVLRLFNESDSVRFERYDYTYYPDAYVEIPDDHWNMSENGSYACKYFLEDGSRPYKTQDCSTCPVDTEGSCVYSDRLVYIQQ